jgi:hypothetical protein
MKRLRHVVCIAFLLTTSAWGQSVSAQEAQQLREQIVEQQKALQAMQATLAEQMKKLEAMTVPAAPAVAPAKAAPAATPAAATVKAEAAKPIPAAPKWYEKYSLRGYTQIRHNRIVATNRLLTCDQCDRNWGNNSNLSVRRARFILSGDINDRIYIYFQPDFASSATSQHFAQVRDLYFDIALDKKKEFRIRAGQSKVPFGFENMQSSQNRLALDRNDGLNSAVSNERDMAAFFYWAPAKIRSRFTTLNAVGPAGLKGSGDYGVIGMGVYNGQTANRAEANNNLHYVARVTYPWQLKSGQYIEASLQGFTGRSTITSDIRSTGTRGTPDFTYTDRRVAASLVIYPQPWGFQTEWNVGKGPEYDTASRTILNKTLRGGYAQTMYMKKFKGQVVTPFYRFQYYKGGKKFELDARRYLVRDHEIGVEWQASSNLELVGFYAHADRTYEDGGRPNNRQIGNVFRLQLQINY